MPFSFKIPIKFKSHKLIGIILSMAVFLSLAAVSYLRLFDRFEYITLDLRYKFRPPLSVSKDIVIVHIGDDTIEKIGEWPLPRKYHGLLAKALKAAGAKTVIFDVFFSEEGPHDEGFASSVREAGNVYIPYVFDVGKTARGDKFYKASGHIAPLIEILQNAAKGTGFINIEPDIDGKVRHVTPFISYNGEFFPQVTFLVALETLGYSFDKIDIIPGKKIVIDKNFVIPVDDYSNIMVDYPGMWVSTFRHYSYVDIIQSYLAAALKQEPIIDLKELRGSVCFVGFTATAAPDAHPSPAEAIYPGVGVHASLYNSMINNKFLYRLSPEWNLAILILLWLIMAVITMKSRKVFAFLYCFLLIASYISLSFIIFFFAGIWIDMLYPVITVALLYLVFTLRKYIIEIEKREILEKELNIAKEIQDSFLPLEIPSMGDMDIKARMLTALQVGGDLYDVIKLDEDRIGVMIGDVSGKGVPAALFMAQVVSVFKYSVRGKSAAEVIKDVNERLVTEGRSNLFVTFSYLIFDNVKKILNFSSGGHLPIMLIEPDGNAMFLDAKDGIPLGLMEGDFSEEWYNYKPGSIFILYTDGVTEAMDIKGNMFTKESLLKMADNLKGRSAEEVVRKIHETVKRFAGKAKQHDDITVVAVKT